MKLFLSTSNISLDNIFLLSKIMKFNPEWTVLHAAAFDGDFEGYKMLAFGNPRNPKDDQGVTPLHVAASSGHFKICEEILTHEIEKNPADNLCAKTTDYESNPKTRSVIKKLLSIETLKATLSLHHDIGTFVLSRQEFTLKGKLPL